MTGMILLAGALLSQAAVPAVSAATPDSHEITASARIQRSGWLTTSRSVEGDYRAWISVADLDLTTEAGYAAMHSRVHKASSLLCDMSGGQPQVRGFYDRGTRDCWRSTEDQGSQQMQSARETARQGRPVATLGLSSAQ